MMEPSATPKGSRYVPFTQQPACCAPTCIQMVMYRHGIPLIPAEELGYHLGLVVSPDKGQLFYKVRTALKPPPAGYGTRIYLPEFEPNAIFAKLDIPLTFSIKSITAFPSPEDLLEYLRQAEASDDDALLCMHHGTLVDDDTKDRGHVCVFDRVIGNQLRIVDPSPEYPKWRLVSPEKVYEAMQRHGVANSTGIWGSEAKVISTSNQYPLVPARVPVFRDSGEF
jgi:hypothetical protein